MSQSIKSQILATIRENYPNYARNNMGPVIDDLLAEHSPYATSQRQLAEAVIGQYLEYAQQTMQVKLEQRTGYASSATTKGIGGIATTISKEIVPVIGVENFGMTTNFRKIEFTVDSRFRNPTLFPGADYFRVKLGNALESQEFSFVPIGRGLRGLVMLELIDATFPNIVSNEADDSYRNEPYIVLNIEELQNSNFTNKTDCFGKIYQDVNTPSTAMFGRMDPQRKPSIQWDISHPHNELKQMTLWLTNPIGGDLNFGTDAVSVDEMYGSASPNITSVNHLTSHGFVTGDKVFFAGLKLPATADFKNNEILEDLGYQTYTINYNSATVYSVNAVHNNDTAYSVGSALEANFKVYSMNLKRQVALTFRAIVLTDDNRQ